MAGIKTFSREFIVIFQFSEGYSVPKTLHLLWKNFKILRKQGFLRKYTSILALFFSEKTITKR
jgi:hypothetical protein